MRVFGNELDRHDAIPANASRSDHSLRWLVLKYAVILSLGFAFVTELGNVVLAQRGTAIGVSGTKRGFILYGDVVVDASKSAEPGPAVLDVILYTSSNTVYGRQRITPNGRYRFLDLFDGDYYLVIEFENKEITRSQVFISTTSPVELKQDISLEWRSGGVRSGASVVSAADLYNRSTPNKELYRKSAQQIDSKNYADAITTLLQLVASDPKDFVALSDLGMLYLIKKDYEAAENSYAGALAANPNYFPALLSQGRVQLARKNYERAIESLEAALKLDPKSASANFFLGEAYLQIKKGSKAVGYLNEALKLDPVGMADAHLRLAALYNGAGMKDKAATEYEQFLKTKPDYADRKKLEEYISANKKQ
jgi:Tfp pilus assembly protein PilF